jgi:hypothetical protein
MRFDLLDAVHLEIQDLDVAQRVAVNQAIGAMAPREPAQTNEITIAFDYCLVHIERPWYLDRLVTQPIWMMPGHAKGDLTAEGQVVALSMVPIAFVAIRKLEIKANWTHADLTSASLATDFGPFRVDPGVVAGTLSHVGLQIVGWLLEKCRSCRRTTVRSKNAMSARICCRPRVPTRELRLRSACQSPWARITRRRGSEKSVRTAGLSRLMFTTSRGRQLHDGSVGPRRRRRLRRARRLSVTWPEPLSS